ncbi:MAG: hypothetical protein ACP5P3_03490 [Ignavibacteria bacterium]
MIPVLLFFIHTIFAVYVFVKTYQSEGLIQAFLNVAFIIIIFSVGWTISDLIMGFFISAEGYRVSLPTTKLAMILLKISGFIRITQDSIIVMPRDSISLLGLSIMEYFFYKFLFKETLFLNEKAVS